jgi:hypothetical protein
MTSATVAPRDGRVTRVPVHSSSGITNGRFRLGELSSHSSGDLADLAKVTKFAQCITNDRVRIPGAFTRFVLAGAVQRGPSLVSQELAGNAIRDLGNRREITRTT